jgi:hypothetical protein
MILNFAKIPVNTVSLPINITVSNIGGGVLKIGAINDPVGDFKKVSDSCSWEELELDQSCQVGIRFEPKSLGVQTSELMITSNDENVTVELTGTTPLPKIEVKPKSLDFGEVVRGSTSCQNLTISNTGEADLQIGAIQLTEGDFTVVTDQCSNTEVEPAGQCVISVCFAPNSVDQQVATLSIPTDDPDTQIIAIELSGSGIIQEPDIKVEPLTINFDFDEIDVSNNLAEVITVSNIGNSPLEIKQISLQGDEEFTILHDRCSGQTVNPKLTCLIVVLFQLQSTIKPLFPILPIDNKTATLSIPSNDPDTPVVKVSLQATASCKQGFSFSPNPSNFGTEKVGDFNSLNLSIYSWAYNCGELEINADELEIIGTNANEFLLQKQRCYHGYILFSYYSSCLVKVIFSPIIAGTKTAELVVPFSDDTQTIVPLQANASDDGSSKVTISPNPYDFGTVTTNFSKQQNFTLTNTGDINLKNISLRITGTNSKEFRAINNCPALVMPDQKCSIAVTFTPEGLNNRQANLIVTSNAPDPAMVSLSGTGKAADCSNNNITISTVANGSWNNSRVWDRSRLPRESDIVQIKANHTITGMSSIIKVRVLCIKAGGKLESLDNKGTSLRIEAEDYIENQGVIQGKNGAEEIWYKACRDRKKPLVGTDNCARHGASVYLKALASQGKFLNKGIILSGNGGNGKRYAANGGNIYIRAKNNILNSGFIEAGKGGNITGIQFGQAGQGSRIFIHSDNYFISFSGSIRAGDGGNCNPRAIQPQGGGNGGDVAYFAKRGVFIQSGIMAAGRGGKNCRPHGINGKDGKVKIHPSILELSGISTKVEGDDVILFGGDDWLLSLNNLDENAITATNDITLAVGKGSTIDLRGNPDKILKAGGQVNIFADKILLDEDVNLEDLVEATNIVLGPSKILYNVFLSGPNQVTGLPGETLPVTLQLNNGSPKADSYFLSVTDAAGWSLSGLPATVELEELASTELTLNVTLPIMSGEMDVITVTAISQADPTVMATVQIPVIVAGMDGEVGVEVERSSLGFIPSTCASQQGIVDWVCKNNPNQVLTDVTIGSQGNVSGGALAGYITNEGLISNITVQDGTWVEGGKFTGHIKNAGTLAHFEFVGELIEGGTLFGTVTNHSLIGGTIKDVNLAANTTLSGGNLQGNIVGDNSDTVLLENVTIKSGSFITGVKLGEGVTVEDNVICGADVQAPEGVCQTTLPTLESTLGPTPEPQKFPDLGITATDKDGKEVPTNATIQGGIAIKDGPFKPTATPTLADQVTIQGQIQIDPTHVGQAGDVVVYVEYMPLGADKVEYFMLNDKSEPVGWDSKLAHLEPIQVIPKLGQSVEVLMYPNKELPVTGKLDIWFGYRLTEAGLTVHNLNPIEVNISNK